MFKKTLIITIIVMFLSISAFIYSDPDEPTFEDLVGQYPEILFEDLENYNYTIEVHGFDYYVVSINGTLYIVKL